MSIVETPVDTLIVEMAIPDRLDLGHAPEKVQERFAECVRFLNTVPEAETRLDLAKTLMRCLNRIVEMARDNETPMLTLDFAPCRSAGLLAAWLVA